MRAFRLKQKFRAVVSEPDPDASCGGVDVAVTSFTVMLAGARGRDDYYRATCAQRRAWPWNGPSQPCVSNLRAGNGIGYSLRRKMVSRAVGGQAQPATYDALPEEAAWACAICFIALLIS